ncbi:cyclin-dependent kinase regulatory subunit CKS1 [Gorgonomyces haynaldii]|nr:cyclin-dependent kinase regulatory subunit CKS1 [Gorgonomyces haynaldii]
MLSNRPRTSRKLSETEQKQLDIQENEDEIFYSSRYYDDLYEYRHVIVPKAIAKWLPQGRLMEDHEWRSYGIRQSAGWVHYMIHNPEPHILLFRREKDYQTKYGNNPPPAAVGGLAG